MQVKWRIIIIGIALIWVVSLAGGFVLGIAHVPTGAVLINLFSILAGLTLVGCLVPQKRWVHLMLTGAGLWITSALNIALGVTTLPNWLFSILFIAIAVGIAGLISMLISALIKSAAKPPQPRSAELRD